MEFEQVWRSIRSKLAKGMEVKNWTVQKGYLGDTMRVSDLGTDYIIVDTPGARTLQRVHKNDFEEVWNIWEDYKAGKVPRQVMTPLTRFSKYVISILHWWENL